MSEEIAKGISFPFRIGSRGRIATSKATFEDHRLIHESIHQILLTPKGSRLMEPEFGSRIPELVFKNYKPPLNAAIMKFSKQALERWEPRINVLSINVEKVDNSGNKHGIISIRVRYKLIDSQETSTVEVVVVGGEEE